MKQRVADYIADFLASKGISTVFSVVGGGAMHLNDAFGKHERLRVFHNHHEQASAMAAEGYARVNEQPAAVCVTTGPGGTNAMTGVLCAWQDNVPVFVISGQVRYSTTVEYSELNLRQMGEQEYYIIRSVAPMTKYAYMVRNPEEIRYVLEKAYYIMLHGRRGPVWVDVPLNVQGATIETDLLESYVPPVECEDYTPKAEAILKKLHEAKAPLILAGASVRRSGAHADFVSLASKLRIPILAPTCVADLLPNTHPYYFQNFGVVGGRTGNFLVQNADVILSIGCRLSLNQIGFNYEAFAPQAYKIVVDVDEVELQKPTLRIAMPVKADLKPLLQVMNEIVEQPWLENKSWLDYARALRENFPLMAGVHDRLEGVNPYRVIDTLLKNLSSNSIIITGNSSGSAFALHHGIEKMGQRLWGNRNCGTMGYDLPAALGAAIAKNGQVICLTGDGSIQMNLQELQTMVLNKIPLKIMIYNNHGYMGIVRTQKNYFGGRLTGCTPESGLDCPDWGKIAYAYGIPYCHVKNRIELEEKLPAFLDAPGYALCEMVEDSSQGPAWKTTSKKLPSGDMISAPLDELEPRLSPEEFEKYHDWKTWKEQA